MKRIILIDGYCNLCNGFVSIVYNDNPNLFYYGTINETDLLNDEDSIAFMFNNKIYRGPMAVIKILSNLSFKWRIVSLLLRLFPNFVTNFFYKIIASNRYKIFGKKNTCNVNNKIPEKFKIK